MTGTPVLGQGLFAARLADAGQVAVPVLEAGRLHELHAASAHRAAALAFALAQGRGAAAADGALFLVRRRQGGRARLGLHGEGLALFGIDPAQLTIVDTADDTALLRAGFDAARCPALDVVVIESAGRLPAYDLTASRRLALAVERSRGRVVMLRLDAEPRPSAAFTRWAIASAPSVPLPGAAPGHPALEVELQRRRGAATGQRWRLEWDSNHGLFRDMSTLSAAAAALSGAVVSLPGVRAGPGAGRHRAA